MKKINNIETKITIYNISHSSRGKIIFINFSVPTGFNVAASASRDKNTFYNFSYSFWEEIFLNNFSMVPQVSASRN